MVAAGHLGPRTFTHGFAVVPIQRAFQSLFFNKPMLHKAGELRATACRVRPGANLPVAKRARAQCFAGIGNLACTVRFHAAAVPQIGFVLGEHFRAGRHQHLVAHMPPLAALIRFQDTFSHGWARSIPSGSCLYSQRRSVTCTPGVRAAPYRTPAIIATITSQAPGP